MWLWKVFLLAYIETNIFLGLSVLFPEFCTLFDKCLLAKPKCFADKAGNVLAIATCIVLLKSVSFMAFHCQYGWVRYLFPQVHMSLRPRSVTIYWCISWSSCFVGVLCVIKQTLDDPQHIGGSHQAGEFPDWNDFPSGGSQRFPGWVEISCLMGWITNSGMGPWSLKRGLYIPTAFVHLMTGHSSEWCWIQQ